MSHREGSRPARTQRGAAGVPGRPRQASDAVLTLAGRLVGAGLLGTMAGIHLHLYTAGYRGIASIGPLFMLNAVLGVLAALAVLAIPRRWLGWASLAGALLQ